MKADPLKQAAKDGKVIQQGARLHVALQTPQGRVFLEEATNYLDQSIQKLLIDPITSEAELLSHLYEARGVMSLLADVGDKLQAARRLSMKRAVQNQLRMTEPIAEEDE